MLQKTDYGICGLRFLSLREFAKRKYANKVALVVILSVAKNLQNHKINLKFKGKIALKFAKLLTKVEIQGIVF